ncbi:hypothetical protein IPA_06670 [Ignicoccus pacificus DSM 13166]|uniref:CBS domain-containing protein n=1 Tax=Ignicoccus pacificus DSM 13166 TaxID=940294 RepID=A0A977PL22_9CREN|nr:hypothetical protein IPA_06670 [Ignicoccus pacificus DSM 13166]
MKVSELAREVPWILPGLPVREAARLMDESNSLALLVKTVDDEFLGVFGYTELLDAASRGELDEAVEEYVNTEPPLVLHDADIKDAVLLFKKHESLYLVVLNDKEEPYALLSVMDVMKMAASIIENIFS